MKKPKILVVGSINMDLTVYGVPKLPVFGESLPCDNYAFQPGGKGANQAVAAAKLGAESQIVGALGKDDYSEIIIDSLNDYGVGSKYVSCSSDTQTGLAMIMVDKATAKYVSYVILGGNSCINETQIKNAMKDNEFDMVLMQLEMPLEIVYRTYELARDRGIPVFLDAGPAMKIPLERLKGIFVISPNEAETQALTGIELDSAESAVLAAKRLYEQVQPKYVILKLGARGALLYDGNRSELIPCFNELEAVDSTAAGDTFSAAFSVSYCNGVNARDSIIFAHAAAGLCVSKKGAQIAIPTLSEVNEFLRNKE